MSRPIQKPNRTVILTLLAVILAGCSSPGAATEAADISPEVGIRSTPSVTASPAVVSTPTPPQPTLTPTATATPLPQPISFDNISQLQIIRDIQNWDDSFDMFSQALSPDGRFAAAAGCLHEDDDMECHGTTFFRIYDVRTGEVLNEPVYLSPAIEVLAFSPDGNVLAAAGCDINLWIYGELETYCDLPRAWMIDTASGELIAELDGYTSHVTDFAFSPESSTLFTSVAYYTTRGDGDHVIRAYDTRSGERLAMIETGMINCTEMLLDISPDGHTLVGNVTSGCGTQSFVAWWDVSDITSPVKLASVDSYSISSISPDSTRILVGNRKDRTLKLLDLQTGSPLESYPALPGKPYLTRLFILADMETALVDYYGEYIILDLTCGYILHTLRRPECGIISSIFLTPDRKTLILIKSVDDYYMEAWDLDTWQSISVDLDPDNNFEVIEFAGKPRMTFLPDAASFVGINLAYGSIRFQTWGFPDSDQAEAVQALREYLDLLASGDYAAAADLYVDESGLLAAIDAHAYFEPFYPASYLASQISELDFSDVESVLAELCQEEEFPCMPLREVLYQAKIVDGLYRFTVTFSLPDGSLADWQPCNSLPADYYCLHRGGVFEYFVHRTTEGDFMIVEGLPPAIALIANL